MINQRDVQAAGPLTTRAARVLGVRHPIVQAGMAVHTSAELVAAVSNAGGLGLIGTVFRELVEVVEHIHAVRALTVQPFGANIVLAEPHDALLDALIEARVPVVSTSWGDPTRVVHAAHDAGLLVIHQVETVAEVATARAAGVDIIIAQGSDGGGHIGRVGTLALVPAVVDAAGDVPVLAAGGIADGRGLAAVLALGAEGVLLGTRFLATREAPVPDGWKQAILAAHPEDAWQSDVPDLAGDTAWDGATVRVLANRLLRDWHARAPEIVAARDAINTAMAAADARGDMEGVFLYAGQSAGLIHDIPSAADLVERIVSEAAAVLAGLNVA